MMRKVEIGIGDAGAKLIGMIHPDYTVDRAAAFSVRPSIVVCPGGGYAFLSIVEEDEAASALYASGYNVFSLHYSVGDAIRESEPERELALAISRLRAMKDELGIGDGIGVMGFSAGGHLAACSCCHWKRYGAASRPDCAVLCYPVTTMGEYGHEGSTIALCHGDGKRVGYFSLENQVEDGCPPVFLWHTQDDDAVDIHNSLMFYTSLVDAGIPCEYHAFQHGLHGMALGDDASGMPYESASQWFPLARKWLGIHLDFNNRIFL